jgi:nucleotide-binding universal stress UspA family protein
MFQNILICTDGSELSAKAVDSGIALAAKLDAAIIAFTVAPRHVSVYYEGSIAPSPSEIKRMEKEWNDQAQKVLDAVQEKALARNVKTKTLIGHGSVAESIIAAAKKKGCDLIVMASHGRKGISRVLLGSETLDVLTHSHVPVLVLR